MLCTLTLLRSISPSGLLDSPRRGIQPGTNPNRTIRGPALMSLTSTITLWSAKALSICPAICSKDPFGAK